MSGRSSQSTSATAALLTPRGRGAVATLRVCGDCDVIGPAIDQFFRAANNRCLNRQSIDRICFGRWHDNTDVTETPTQEEVVVCRISESIVEVHCHGGDVAVDRILTLLSTAGVARSSWQEQKSLLTGPFAVECEAALTRATTVRTAGILLEQSSGCLHAEVSELLELTATSETASVVDDLQSRLETLLGWSVFGQHLTEPWRVVLAGRPNAGKSTLVNALLGYSRAIVYDQPGTTRDVVTGNTAFDGWPVQLADTAGVRDTTDSLERQGVERTFRAVDEADLVVLLLDTSEPQTSDDERLVEWLTSADTNRPPFIVVAHKADLPSATPQHLLPEDALQVSSVSGSGVDPLIHEIVARLIPRIPESGTPIPVTSRQVNWLQTAAESLSDRNLPGVCKALQNCLDGTP